jgi:hypothetical protein
MTDPSCTRYSDVIPACTVDMIQLVLKLDLKVGVTLTAERFAGQLDCAAYSGNQLCALSELTKAFVQASDHGIIDLISAKQNRGSSAPNMSRRGLVVNTTTRKRKGHSEDDSSKKDRQTKLRLVA